MTTVMPSSARGASSLTSTSEQATQNTAAVHEFRCLYTHDAHKKAKKWHDGSTRFHTFNRRVMLYDDSKNFVSGLHFRQDDEFEEGLEIRLDGGVLVELGERLGETQTDLAPILDRKKDDASPKPARNLRLVAAASQTAPKPLSQILGTQSRMGRARPLPASYQQRRALTLVQPSEALMPPPPKRQKLDQSSKENQPASSITTALVAQTTKTRPETSRAPSHLPPPGKIAIEYQEVVDLSSDEETVQAAGRRQTAKTSIQKTASSLKNKVRTQEKEFSSTSTRKDVMSNNRPKPMPRVSTTDYPPTSSRLAKKSTPNLQSHARAASTASKVVSSRTSSRPNTTSLKFRDAKPRRKLMYKALLPSFKPGLASHSRQASRESSIEKGYEPADDSPSSTALGPELHSPLPDAPLPPRRGSVDDPVQIISSPLFVPQDTNPGSPGPHSIQSPHPSQDSLLGQMIERPETPRTREVIKGQKSAQETTDLATTSQADLPTTTTDIPLDPFPSNRRQILPPPLLSADVLAQTVTPTSRERAFRRVRSENDAQVELEDDLADFDRFSVPLPSFLATSRLSPIRPHRNKSRSPAKLRRIASDSAAIEPKNRIVPAYNVQPVRDDVGEIGPWTSTEAYLLFEWWPPGKAKPDHGVVAPAEMWKGQRDPTRATIVTARDMLRDEINVL